MRIHIVGGPGSGKTTVAEDLASSTGIPVFSLDEVAYRVQGTAVRPLEDRQRIVREIASLKEWITEGVYLWWTDELLSAADVVLWLDPRWRVAVWRIVVRHIRKSIAGSYAFSGVRQLLHFLRLARMYYMVATPVRPA